METEKETTTICLTVVRHGETEANRSKIIQGQSNSSLSENGKRQAQHAGIALQNNPFDKIYSSDLERAFDTASIIATKNFYVPILIPEENHNVIEVNKLLRERCLGIFEMKSYKEFETAAQNAGFVVGENIYDFKPEGGEGILDVKERIHNFLDYLKKTVNKDNSTGQTLENKKHNILIVSHGGWIRHLANYLMLESECELPSSFKDLDKDGSEKLLEKYVKNTAISNFDLQIDVNTSELVSVKCITYACAKHLELAE